MLSPPPAASGRLHAGLPVVQLNQVSVRFSSSAAVQDVDLSIGEGEFVAVVDPTGYGENMSLNTAMELLKPAGGTVSMFGELLTRLNDNVGFMMQQDSLLPQETTLDNVTLGLVFQSMSVDEAHECARPWMKRIGLAGFGARYPHQLSGGQKKCISMTQMLILPLKAVLMDEPFSMLDVHMCHLIQSELLCLWQGDRRSLLFTTRDPEEVIALAGRVAVMSTRSASHPVGDVEIMLPHPRNVSKINMSDTFTHLYREVWSILNTEVEKNHAIQC